MNPCAALVISVLFLLIVLWPEPQGPPAGPNKYDHDPERKRDG